MNYKRKKTSKKNFFDEWEFNSIISISATDPEKADSLYKEYLEKYHNDYSIITWYISNLVTLGRYEEANTILNELEETYKNDKSFLGYKDKVSALKVNIIYAKIKLLMYQEKYQEAYDLTDENFDLMINNDYDVKRVIFLCKKRLNMLNENYRTPNSYLFRQIVDYEEPDFLYHISKRHLDLYDEDNIKNELLFDCSFPIEQVVNEIKKYIPSSKVMHFGLIEDTYTFKYDNCGKFKGKTVDYFRVISLINSNTLITMYPYDDSKYSSSIDLNYLKEDKTPVKRKSMIDKFNQRYGNR